MNRSNLFVMGVVSSLACGPVPSSESEATDTERAPFSSNQATLLTFSFDGELETSNSWGTESIIRDQMLYTMGHLNGDRAVGRLDRLILSNVKTESLGNGKRRIRYHAVLPVGWGTKTNLPTSYNFTLPRNVDAGAFEAFTAAYKDTCIDASAHDVDVDSMWYYYRPAECTPADADVVRFTATVSVSPENTQQKYPEYNKVWEDNALKVVAIFGKYEDGATTGDAGISAYNAFASRVKSALPGTIETIPASIPAAPGVANPDLTFRSTLSDGRSVEVVALLVDNVRQGGPAYDARYEALSTEADLIFYGGHSGLGQNIRFLTQKGSFRSGKYQIFFMNGCDSFAYVDGYLAQARAALNPDDLSGTKYMDIITNVMPSYFHENTSSALAIIGGLLDIDTPKTYDQMFASVDLDQVVVVTGEEDNVFTPGGVTPPPGWEGMKHEGTISRGKNRYFVTPELAPGQYVFQMTDLASAPVGDIDLYAAVGRKVYKSDYDYRPYLDGTAETIEVTITEPSKVYLMLNAYSGGPTSKSGFVLIGQRK